MNYKRCWLKLSASTCLAETFSQHCLKCISLDLQGNEVQVVE